MTNSLEDHDEWLTDEVLAEIDEAAKGPYISISPDDVKNDLRKSRPQAEQESSRRETLLRNAYSRAKRATDSAVAISSYRLRIAREQWQKAVDEGR